MKLLFFFQLISKSVFGNKKKGTHYSWILISREVLRGLRLSKKMVKGRSSPNQHLSMLIHDKRSSWVISLLSRPQTLSLSLSANKYVILTFLFEMNYHLSLIALFTQNWGAFKYSIFRCSSNIFRCCNFYHMKE